MSHLKVKNIICRFQNQSFSENMTIFSSRTTHMAAAIFKLCECGEGFTWENQGPVVNFFQCSEKGGKKNYAGIRVGIQKF